MERRFRVRLEEMLDDAEVPPALLRGVLPRLQTFLEPFVASLARAEQRHNVQHYVQGLLSDLEDKNAEAIAYLHDQQRQALQKFLGQSLWDHEPLLDELVRQVATELGEPDGVLVLDPSAFPKKGTGSVGVQRQWCGRLGKLDNCQVGLYLGYVSRREHALVDVRLYLPQEWAKDHPRRTKAGVPRTVRFRTRHQLALQLLDRRGPLLPHAWVTGDDEMGRCAWFRKELRKRQECYLLAVPSNTQVRDLAAGEPPGSGRGRPRRAPFVRVDEWARAQTADAWQTIEVRAGEKGPLAVQGTRTLVQARYQRRVSDAVEWLVVFREQQGDGTWKHDYLLAEAPLTTSLTEFARVFKAEHMIEDCLKRAKGEAGLADYQVRTWEGWHHHQALSLVATWFLTQETRRGKNTDAGADRAAGAAAHRGGLEPASGLPPRRAPSSHGEPLAEAQRGGPVLPLEATQPLAATTV
jgi:SRSO17 transposase